jgi:RNA polymerase sigma-70 factor (ECF subfamily)
LEHAPQNIVPGRFTADVEACRRGDRKALDALFRLQMPALERLIRRLVGLDAEAEDLLEQTLIAAIHAFPRYRGEASVERWLASIAVNVVHQYFRRPERKRRVALELISADALIDGAPLQDRVAEGRSLVRRLYGILALIPSKKRIPFVLHVFDGRPVDEVAAIVGASVVATKSRIFWARRALLARARKDPALLELCRSERQP